MKKQVAKLKTPAQTAAAPRVRRPMRDLLYGPGAVRLRPEQPAEEELSAKDEEQALMEEEFTANAELDAAAESPSAQLKVEALEAAAERAPEQPFIEEERQDSDSRARRIVSGMLENEKKNLPDWVNELLAPLDEPAQLAFLIKNKARIKAAVGAKAGIPPSPSVATSPQSERKAVMGHRRLYDSF